MQSSALRPQCEESKTSKQVSSQHRVQDTSLSLVFSPHSAARSTCLLSSLRASAKTDRVQLPVPSSMYQTLLEEVAFEPMSEQLFLKADF